MTTTITKDNLVDGISLYPGIPPHTLIELIPQPHRDLGLGGGATDSVRAWARRRALDDFSRRGIDIDGAGLNSDTTERIRAAMCFLVLAHLYEQNSSDKEDFYATKCVTLMAEYDRTVSTTEYTTQAGYDTDLGSVTIDILRGS